MAQQKDKKGPAKAPAGPSAEQRSARFRFAMRAWVVLMGASWAATVGYGLAAFGWVSLEDMGGVPAPGPVGLAVGAALGVAIMVGCLNTFGSRFDYLKPGQARMVRGTALGAIAALTAFGCATLYSLRSDESLWGMALGAQEVYGQNFAIRPMLFPSLAVFFTVMFVVYLLVNRVLWTDFLVETEGELKKVSWPKRQEYIGSSIVVVVVVLVVSVFLFVSDWVLSVMMKQTGIGF